MFNFSKSKEAPKDEVGEVIKNELGGEELKLENFFSPEELASMTEKEAIDKMLSIHTKKVMEEDAKEKI